MLADLETQTIASAGKQDFDAQRQRYGKAGLDTRRITDDP